MKIIVFIIISVLFLAHRILAELGYEQFVIESIDDVLSWIQILIPRIIIIGIAYLIIF